MSKLFVAVALSILVMGGHVAAQASDAGSQDSTEPADPNSTEAAGESAVEGDEAASANTFVGNWLRQDIEDPFVDEEQFALVIGADGERYTGEGTFFGVICKGGLTDVVYFRLDAALPNNTRQDFDYRVDGGEVATAEGWMNANLVSLRSGEDDFETFKNDTLQDNAGVAVTTESAQGARLVAEFALEGLDAALSAVACQK